MEITLEITKECALKCDICSSDAGSCSKEELSTKEWFKVIEQCSRINASEICISGGEPFLRSDLGEIIEYAKKSGLIVTIYTSGNIFGSKLVSMYSLERKFLSEIAENVDKLAVGLHGSNAEIHDIVTNVSGSYSKLRETISIALDFGIPVTGHFVPIKSNYHDIQATVHTAIDMGLSKLGILRFVPQGRGLRNQSKLELSEFEMNEFVNLIQSMKNHERKFIKIGAPLCSLFPATSARCSLGRRLTIQPNGALAPCEALKDYTNNIAALNIRNITLKELFQSNWISNLLSKSHLSQFTSESCIAQEIQKLNATTDISSEKKRVHISH